MFDWNDQELTNIIWGETGESDDHIVPYEKPPTIFGDPTKKETNREFANVEQKKRTIKSEHRVKPDNSSEYDPATGFGLGSWPDEPNPSLSDAAKADQDSMGKAAPNIITKNSKNGSLRDEMAQFDKDSEIFHNPPDDREQGDLVDYGWANIGSFDDLDRIFSDNDPIFGDISVGNTEELWTSSKDVTGSPLGSTPPPGDSSDFALGPLRTSLDPSHSFTPHAPQDVQARIDTTIERGGKTKLFVKEKTFEMGGKIQACQKQLDDGTAPTLPDKFFSCAQGKKQKRLVKGQKLDKKSEVRNLHDIRGTWSPFEQVNNNQYAPPMVNHQCPPSLFPRPESFQQNCISSPPLASPLYGNVVNYYPAPSVVAQSSGYAAVPPGIANLKKPPAMTPKEKIEKLRRRQQMRAELAIQKQQQQFRNQAEHSTMESGKVEPSESLNLNTPIEHDDSNTISMAVDNCSVEESVLYRLQDTIANLDIRIRLCIRDSLFRLAQSAMQRQYSSDNSSPNTISRDLGNKDTDNHERFTGVADVETDTNPIDRTVAHLLFHRPLDFSGKPSKMPGSPIFANLQEKKPISTQGFIPDDFVNTPMTSPQGSKTPRVFSEGDQSKNNPHFDTSENASNNEATDGGPTKAESLKRENLPSKS